MNKMLCLMPKVAFTMLQAVFAAVVSVSLLVAPAFAGDGVEKNAQPVLEAETVSWAWDMPLMPGLVLDEDLSFAFDQPSGRVAEVIARGDADIAAVTSFYAQVLPELGWEAAAKGHLARHMGFVRGREALEVHIEPQKNPAAPVLVRMVLAPIS